MALEEMYGFVFSDDLRQRRAVPDVINPDIKRNLTLTKVRQVGTKLQKEMNPVEFEKLKEFIVEWIKNKNDKQKVSDIKSELVKRAYKADVDWSVYEDLLLQMKQEFMIETLLKGLSNGRTGSISSVHKARLLQCIAYAIKVGLNYQELAPFKFDMRLVPTKKLDEDDLPYVYPGKVVTKAEMAAIEKQKKAHVGDLMAMPLYENIDVPKADLGEYIRVEKLRDIPDQLVNPTKRKVLQMIYKISPDFKLNLDDLDEKQLKELCKLDLPMSVEAFKYFYCVEHEAEWLGKLDEAYRKWLSESSFKKYMGKSSARRFLTLSPIREVEAKSVEDVLSGDFKALESLVYHVKPSVSGLPSTSAYNPDVDYAKRLSQELQKLDVLPAGFDYLCAVKAKVVDEPTRKRKGI